MKSRNPQPQRKTPTWKHPWCGLSVMASNAAAIAKQVPEMCRPVEQRAQGPRDHKSPLGVMLMYSGTSRGTWSGGLKLFPENLPRVDFAELEARVMSRYAK